ncbi:unnamed protein product, partial [Staurois parvus]
ETREKRRHSYLHQAQASRQQSLNSRNGTVLRFPVKQMSPSRKSTGIPRKRQDSKPSTNPNKTSEDHESHLTHQIDGLVLSEKDSSESSSCNTGQESHNPQTSPQLIVNQKFVSKHDETAWIDGFSIVETQNIDPIELLTFQTISTRKEEQILDIGNKDVKEEFDIGTKKGVIQGQLLEEETESYSELHLGSKENHETEGLQPKVASDVLIQSEADTLNNPQGDVSTKTQSQEDATSSHEHLKKSPRVKTKSKNVTLGHNQLKVSPRAIDSDTTDERCVSLPAKQDPITLKTTMDFSQTSSPAEENIADTGASSSEGDTKSQISSWRNDVIRRSQGVLVLTRNTDENAIFIPKLKFEFTPDNSIDWTTLPQLLTNKHSNHVKEKDPSITMPCTPRGPSFSKSILKKSSASQGFIPTARSNSESIPGSFGAENSAQDSVPPLHGIVDLSISFQGKYEGDEIPKDIPKLLLMEEDSDED